MEQQPLGAMDNFAFDGVPLKTPKPLKRRVSTERSLLPRSGSKRNSYVRLVNANLLLAVFFCSRSLLPNQHAFPVPRRRTLSFSSAQFTLVVATFSLLAKAHLPYILFSIHPRTAGRQNASVLYLCSHCRSAGGGSERYHPAYYLHPVRCSIRNNG